MSKKILRADDKRRTYHKTDVSSEGHSTGAGRRAGEVFHDRRSGAGTNGKGKRAK